MLALALGLIALSLVGHAAFWVGIVNRWHATGFPRAFVKSVTLVFYAALIFIPPVIVLDWTSHSSGSFASWMRELNWATCYAALAAAYGAMHLSIWITRRWRSRQQLDAVRLLRQQKVDVARELGFAPLHGLRTALFARVPGNQLWQLQVSEFSVHIPRLPSALDGLSVCHWSDLHFSGRIGPEYFREVVRRTNALGVDLIALSGDICDKARYIDWIPETLAAAEARLGKFFILGNHDLRTKDILRLRAVMREAGFIDVGGRCETIEAIGGARIEIAGNERPWFKNVPPARSASHSPDDSLRILLSHTPDELAWARGEGFDLMLAGHTHGGQIRFPGIGPVVCPSWHGVKYAAGFFHEPPTVLHVSRGTGSLFPMRLNCPPEITKLVLRKRWCTRGVETAP
jgi:hypothetical protein